MYIFYKAGVHLCYNDSYYLFGYERPLKGLVMIQCLVLFPLLVILFSLLVSLVVDALQIYGQDLLLLLLAFCFPFLDCWYRSNIYIEIAYGKLYC